MDYTPNVVSKRCFFLYIKHSWAPKRSWKVFHRVLVSPGKVLDFVPVKEWEPRYYQLNNRICVRLNYSVS